jgi:hypothetical protein
MEMGIFVIRNWWLVWSIFIAWIVLVAYVLLEITSNGNDHWIWIVFVLLLSPIAVPVYLIRKFKCQAEEWAWDERQRIAHEFKDSYDPRKAKSEAELVEAYYKAKAQKFGKK